MFCRKHSLCWSKFLQFWGWVEPNTWSLFSLPSPFLPQFQAQTDFQEGKTAEDAPEQSAFSFTKLPGFVPDSDFALVHGSVGFGVAVTTGMT